MDVKRIVRYIYVIQSLPDNEPQTGSDLYNDVIRRRIDLIQPLTIKMQHYLLDVKNKESLIHAINYISSGSLYTSGGILIHFEMHGSNNKDGLVLANGSLVTWKEIIDLIRPININTSNNLFITMATCFGRYLYLGAGHFEKSPYQAYISASKEVPTHEVIDKFNLFFELLIESGDIIHAYKEHEKSASPFFYKDSLTTINEMLENVLNKLKTDPDYKKKLLDHPILNEYLASGELAKDNLDQIFNLALHDTIAGIIKAHYFN